MDEHRPPDESSLSPVCRAFVFKLGLTPDKAKRQRIIAACVKVRRDWVEELLWEMLADPNEAVRALVVRELCGRPSLRADWAGFKLEAMRRALAAKFSQHDDLRAQLLATGDAVLLENSKKDSYWGVGADGTGLSMLGRLLMDLRDGLRGRPRECWWGEAALPVRRSSSTPASSCSSRLLSSSTRIAWLRRSPCA